MIKFVKDWRQYIAGDTAEIDTETAKTLIKFGYAEDSSGASGQETDDSAENQDSQHDD